MWLWHRHKWSRWQLIELQLNDDGRPAGQTTVQMRSCETCGKYQRRELGL